MSNSKYNPRLHGVRMRDAKVDMTLQFPLDDFDKGYNSKYESVLDSENMNAIEKWYKEQEVKQ